MTKLGNFFMEYKKKLLLLGIVCAGVMLFELFVFNQGFLIGKVFNLQERQYSIRDGSLYQFNLENRKLVAQGTDPNITFDNVNLPVGFISIRCVNSIPGAVGQVFYRNSKESFNEPHSVRYDASLADKTLSLSQFLGYPKVVTVSSLRFDLTNTLGDIISCSKFVINPHIPLKLSRVRLAGYAGLLLAILIIFRNDNYSKMLFFFQKLLSGLSVRSDRILRDLDAYIKQNGQVITVLGIVALAAYGFELFNLNLTIDEELYAFFTGPTSLWIGEGRWGMYLLNKFLFPYTGMPVMPLFLALVFHIFAILLILNCWEVRSRLEQAVSGALMLTFPTLAYIYMFSSLSFGIGIGFFCVALSLFLYKKNSSIGRWWAVIPASFAIAIYQAFALVLAVVFVVYLIIEIRKGNLLWKNAVNIALILIAAFFVYYLIQKLWLSLLLASLSAGEKSAYMERDLYVQRYFDFASLRENTLGILSLTWLNLIRYYSGQHSDYIISIKTLGWGVMVFLAGFLINLKDQKISILNKLFMFLLSVALLSLPFFGALFTNGGILTRSLLALPVVVAGIFILGLQRKPGVVRASILVLALFCVFQFTVSTNRLFGSSHLALQADRLVAVRLMEKIDEAKAASGIQDLIYLEVVGQLKRTDTQAIPRRSSIGLSFFELVRIGQPRIASFLEISGYQAFKSLPPSRLAEFVGIVDMMPVWPAEGSVKIVGDTALIKFGDYPAAVKLEICAQPADVTLPKDFCPLSR